MIPALIVRSTHRVDVTIPTLIGNITLDPRHVPGTDGLHHADSDGVKTSSSEFHEASVTLT